ncbi:MAG: ComEA family DNA-binding protein [Gemmatimonadaceae bacterium]
MRADQKALMFIGAVAVLGAAVRVVRAANDGESPRSQPALAHQLQAADSAAKAGRSYGGRGARQGTGRGARSRAPTDTLKRKRDSLERVNRSPLDRPGYIGGKLDLDVATVAQIDSLPHVSRLMARRIVLDRMAHGPFVTRDGLRRVSGAGPIFLMQIDSLVAFSGTMRMPSPADTAGALSRKPRARVP